MLFPLFLAAKYLRPKRSFVSVVTFLAVAGVVLGVAIVIIVRAVMTGFGDMWHDKILSFKPHVTINSSAGTIYGENEMAAWIRDIPGVTGVSPSVETRVLLEHKGYVNAPVVIGVDQDGLASLHPGLVNSIVAGSAENLDDDSVLLGMGLASQIGARVGSKVLIYTPMNLASKDELFFPQEAVVAGIFNMGQGQFDGGYVISSIAFARDLMGMERGAYSVHVKTQHPENPAEFDAIVDAISKKLGPTYYVRTWREIDSDIFNALAVEKNMMVILLMFITIVAIFCVTNTLIVITVQKTNEIGLLKALGFSSGQVMWTFVLYGWIQCVVGAVLGVGLAYAVLYNLQNIVDFLAHFGLDVFPQSVYGLDRIPWRVHPLEVAEVAAMVMLFCTLASFIPALNAARRDPVKALHS